MPSLVDRHRSASKRVSGVYKPVGDGEKEGVGVAGMEGGKHVSRTASRAMTVTPTIEIRRV